MANQLITKYKCQYVWIGLFIKDLGVELMGVPPFPPQ